MNVDETGLKTEIIDRVIAINGQPDEAMLSAMKIAIERWQEGETILYIAGDPMEVQMKAIVAINTLMDNDQNLLSVLGKQQGNVISFWIPQDKVLLSEDHKVYLIYLSSALKWTEFAGQLLVKLFPQIPEKCTIVLDRFEQSTGFIKALRLHIHQPKIIVTGLSKDDVLQLKDELQ